MGRHLPSMPGEFHAAHTTATQDELVAHRIPVHARDNCAHVLIPLNECRRANFYATSACGDLRHAYEFCQYSDFRARKAALKEMRMDDPSITAKRIRDAKEAEEVARLKAFKMAGFDA